MEERTTATLPKLDVSVRPIVPRDNLYGFATVTVGGIKIDGFKIAKTNSGKFFVGMPSKPDSKSVTGYRNTVYVSKDVKDEFNDLILGEYTKAVERAQERAENLKPAPAKPERVSAQMKKAQEKADKHNTALPTAEKGATTQDKSGR